MLKVDLSCKGGLGAAANEVNAQQPGRGSFRARFFDRGSRGIGAFCRQNNAIQRQVIAPIWVTWPALWTSTLRSAFNFDVSRTRENKSACKYAGRQLTC